MQRILNLFRSRLPMPHGKIIAAMDDFRTACSLLQLNEAIVGGERNPEHLPSLYQQYQHEWSKKASNLQELITFANDSMTIQLSEMFQHLHDIDSGDILVPAANPSLPPHEYQASAAFQPSIGPSTHSNPLPTLNMQMKYVYENESTQADINIRYTLQQRLGYGLWLGPSQAAYGNYSAGLYLRGQASPGTVIALYPGPVYNSEMLQKAIDCGHLGNPAIQRTFIPRFDESIIDTFSLLANSSSLSNALKVNAYALAQHARHPPQGIVPNVMRIQVDFMDVTDTGSTGIMSFPPHLRDYIPNLWGTDTSIGQGLYSSLEQHVWAKGSVLIALRPLWNEEIFVDHTLNPYAYDAGLIPPWAEKQFLERKEMRMLNGRLSRDSKLVVPRIGEANTGNDGAIPTIQENSGNDKPKKIQ